MIGIDIVEIGRLLNKKDAFALYVLSKQEYKKYQSMSPTQNIHYLAGRFAAKEALVKALRDKTIVFKEVTILNDASGAPLMQYKDYSLEVSISHEKKYAVAIVFVK